MTAVPSRRSIDTAEHVGPGGDAVADRRRNLIFFGFSGDSGRTVTADANWSFLLISITPAAKKRGKPIM